MRVAAGVAFIRLQDGKVGQFDEGHLVSDDADPAHVAELLDKGVLVDDGEDAPEPADPPPPAVPDAPAKRAAGKPGPPRGGSSS